MTGTYLSVGRVERRQSNGVVEALEFKPGVNLLVGRPNTGKTKWLQTLDYLLGDRGDNPFAAEVEDGLAEKYEAAGADVVVGDEILVVERRWREPGMRTKVLVDGHVMAPQEFQHLLLRKLGMPVLHFPKGNPMSGQTWPELSFRMLLRHIYRRQRFWGDIADEQPDTEQHACLLQFLGLAERVFTEEYGQLVALKMRVDRLRARRDQQSHTLDELASEALSEAGMSIGVSEATIREADSRLVREMDALRLQRIAVISGAESTAVPPEHRSHVGRLTEQRASLVVSMEELRRKAKAAGKRLEEVKRYRSELGDELDRLARVEAAGVVLADLKITHCPACDQPVDLSSHADHSACALCHQSLQDDVVVRDLGVARLRFERDRLNEEFKEADTLVALLESDLKLLKGDIQAADEQLRMVDNNLAPNRQAVAGLVQDEVSAIDMALGELNERQRQVARIKAIFDRSGELTEVIRSIEAEIEPLQRHVDESIRATDFGAAATELEDGMNAYLTAINRLRPGVWKHNPVAVDISRSGFTIRVGTRRWQAALGGTNTLYFLMAYHYGLLTLSGRRDRHYPGLSIIDIPAEFSGEAVADKENFIVQPFIELLGRDEYRGAQLIVTGASFSGLVRANRLPLTEVYVT